MEQFLDTVQVELTKFLENVDKEAIHQAARLIIDAKASHNRLHLSGIGKPSYVAAYGASLISSTGTPAYVLHGTEAVHGSAGQLLEGDVVIAISNSGKTQELMATAHTAINNGAKLIAITSNPESPLAKLADVHLQAKVDQEGGPLNRAPRISVLAEMLVIQALSVELQRDVNLSVAEYLKRHPGGSLGQLREGEKL